MYTAVFTWPAMELWSVKIKMKMRSRDLINPLEYFLQLALLWIGDNFCLGQIAYEL